MQFFIAMTPPQTTSQQKGVDFKRGRFYKKQKVAAAEQEYLVRLYPHKPEKPFTKSAMAHYTFIYPWLKSHTKKVREQGYQIKTKKPDCTNSVKLIEDCMTKLGFWTDDAICWKVTVEKWHGDVPGVEILIEGE